MVVPPSVPKKSEPNGKPAARRRTPVNKRVATNGSAAIANGHDASVTVQLQDIQEQQDPNVVVDGECATRPNGYTDPKTAVVPEVADNKGDGAAKKIDWEIPRKTLHSSIGSCQSTVATRVPVLVLTIHFTPRLCNHRPLPWSLHCTTCHIWAASCAGTDQCG